MQNTGTKANNAMSKNLKIMIRLAKHILTNLTLDTYCCVNIQVDL